MASGYDVTVLGGPLIGAATITQAITANASPQFVTLSASAASLNIVAGRTITITGGTTENVLVLAAVGSTFSAVFASNHTTAAVPSSLAFTTTQTSADIQTGGKGVIVTLDQQTISGSSSNTLTVNGKDPASGKYYAILTGAAVVAVTTNVYRIYPGLTAAANATVSSVLPGTIQIVVAAGTTDPNIYSIGASFIP